MRRNRVNRPDMHMQFIFTTKVRESATPLSGERSPDIPLAVGDGVPVAGRGRRPRTRPDAGEKETSASTDYARERS